MQLKKQITTLIDKKIIFISLFVGFSFCLYAQTNSDTLKKCSQLKLPSADEQKDMLDIYKEFIKKDTIVIDTVNKKRKIFSNFVPAVGYTMATGITGVISSNICFYRDTSRYSKLSVISANADYSQYNQYWLKINSNINDEVLNLKFIGDWRIYKFPTNTYGLGGQFSTGEAYRIDFSYLRLHEVVVRKILPNSFIGLGYLLDYHWNIETLSGPEPIFKQLQQYGFNNSSLTSGFSINFRFDNRDNPINPDKGEYADIQLRNNLKALGSDYNSESILIDLRKYFKLPFNSNNILAFWSYNNFTVSGELPYLDLPSTGWDAHNNTGRGYVQGRFRGTNFIYFEGEYRFQITNNGLLGGVVFANAESFTEYPSNKFNTVFFAKGIGLRIKINKNTKSNLTIDYGFGQGKSHGLILNLGEAF